MQETEHFCGRRQQKVAKSVPYALPRFAKAAVINSSGLSLCQPLIRLCRLVVVQFENTFGVISN
jgi:hypothetical protein